MAKEPDDSKNPTNSRPTKDCGPHRNAFTKKHQMNDLSQEPIRSILRKAGKVLNVRGRQFHNLVDVNLSDEERDLSPPPRRLSGPPQSMALKRAFGIEEPRKSGQALMDFFGDRWLEFYAVSGDSKCQKQGSPVHTTPELKRRPLQPVLSKPISILRRPWLAVICDEGYDPPDPARPEQQDEPESPPLSPDPARYSCSW